MKKSATAYAIKITKGYDAGRYYAGYGKNPVATLLGAQLYRSKKTIWGIIRKSVRFHYTEDEFKIVTVKLTEV
ncbi:MAG: hypothetical protein IKO10_03440 [Lachnospiraceae bacterium]|nr:hypothetical protein [Lachnospiraceae bacterium]